MPSSARIPGRCLLLEFWGLGDAAMMTAALPGILAAGWSVTVAAKPATRILLEGTYPEVEWIEFDPPWTVFAGKYRLWRWPWRTLARFVRELRRRRFDAGLSVRRDPRDHVLLRLAGIGRRIGFRTWGTPLLLNEPLEVRPRAHKVEDWRALRDRLLGVPGGKAAPGLKADPALREAFRRRFEADPRPVVALHCGARIAVRRWPKAYFRETVGRLRREAAFQLALFPDPDGYGAGLADLADHVFAAVTLPEMLAILDNAAVLVANDSGPGHIAAALGIPVVSLFGPADPELFRPYGDAAHVVIRDLCAYRPCFDACRFPEPYCLTRLTPAVAGPEIAEAVRRALTARS